MKKDKLRKYISRCLIAVALIMATAVVAYGATTVAEDSLKTQTEAAKYKNFYVNNTEILSQHEGFKNAMRWLGMVGTKWSAKALDAVKSLYDKSFGMIDITTWGPVNDFVNRLKPVFIALTALSLFYLGIVLILNHEKKPQIAINIVIAILVITSSTFIFASGNGMAHAFKDGLEFENNKTAVLETIDNNMLDVADNYNRSGTSLKPGQYKFGNVITSKAVLDAFDINETINYKDKDGILTRDKDAFKYYIAHTNAGQWVFGEVDNGWGVNEGNDSDPGNNFYYRYHFQFFICLIDILTLLIVYLTMSAKCIKVAFELVTSRFLAVFAAAEISGGERIRKLLCFIRDSYILLMLTALCIKIYLMFTQYLSNQGYSGLVRAFFSIILAFVVIDGPNVIERILGMDAGLKSATGRLIAGVGLMRVAPSTMGKAGKGLKKGFSAVAEGLGFDRSAEGKNAAKEMKEGFSAVAEGLGFDRATEGKNDKALGQADNADNADGGSAMNTGDAEDAGSDKHGKADGVQFNNDNGSDGNSRFGDSISSTDTTSNRNLDPDVFMQSADQSSDFKTSMPTRSVQTNSNISNFDGFDGKDEK